MRLKQLRCPAAVFSPRFILGPHDQEGPTDDEGTGANRGNRDEKTERLTAEALFPLFSPVQSYLVAAECRAGVIRGFLRLWLWLKPALGISAVEWRAPFTLHRG